MIDPLYLGGGNFSFLIHFWKVLVLKIGQSESAPTNAPMWKDGALMGASFSSLLVPRLTKVVNSSWPFFFLSLAHVGIFFLTLSPHAHLGLTYLPTFKLLAYAPWPPPSSTYYLLAHLLKHLFTYSPICLPSHQPTYLCTYALNLHQGNHNASRWRYYNIPCRLFHSPSYPLLY